MAAYKQLINAYFIMHYNNILNTPNNMSTPFTYVGVSGNGYNMDNKFLYHPTVDGSDTYGGDTRNLICRTICGGGYSNVATGAGSRSAMCNHGSAYVDLKVYNGNNVATADLIYGFPAARGCSQKKIMERDSCIPLLQ